MIYARFCPCGEKNVQLNSEMGAKMMLFHVPVPSPSSRPWHHFFHDPLYLRGRLTNPSDVSFMSAQKILK